jgi:ferrous iron transport protein B
MTDVALPARIALVGNPNCGKTALFNALTGSRQKVANYPGVTVERKEAVTTTPAGVPVRLLDLPGTYSLRARSLDEVVTRDVVLGRFAGEDVPRLLVCVADSTNLRLALRLALELKRVGRPIILALNMFDIARHRGVYIDLDRLSAELGIPVVPSVAVRRGGTSDLLARIDAAIAQRGLPDNSGAGDWSEPSAAELRAAQREADRILAAAVHMPTTADDFTRQLDRIVLHPVLGLAILLAVLFLMFQAVFAWAQLPMDLIKSGFGGLGAWVGTVLPAGWVRSFIEDGVISGLGSVIVFLPQILILFLFILLLEDFGYMARAAFLMDRIMGGAGLHGRAFIPLLSSFACAIPGIMATRVIDSRRDRLATILVAPLMTCSARIPVYTLIISAFVPARAVWGAFNLQGLVMFGLYAAGIAAALGVSWLLRRLLWRREPSNPFMLELPDYKRPIARNVALGLWQRGKIFLRRAGTIIFSMMVVIWFLCSVPGAPDGAAEPAINYSLAARIGHVMEPVLAPVGFNWQIDVALVPGMAAREVAVASLGTVYAVEGTANNPDQLGHTLAAKWSLATALALLAWYVFAPQCA